MNEKNLSFLPDCNKILVMAFVVRATVHLIAEVHYPHFSSESDHHTPPNQAPRAQNWCQAVHKDLQGPCLFAQNDLMAWHGLESTLCHPLFTWIN